MASTFSQQQAGSSPTAPHAARNRSPSDGDPVIRRQLSGEFMKHVGTAKSLREIIKNLVHDTYGVTVVGLKRLSAFKDVNFLIDGTLPSLEAVEEQPAAMINGGDENTAAYGGDAGSGHKPAHRSHSSHQRHHHGPQQPVQKFLLKMLNEAESGKEAMINLVDGQTTLARHLEARGFPTHVPIPSKSGALFELLPVPFAEFLLYHIDKTTDHESVMVTLSKSLVRLFPFLPGVPLADVPELGEHELHDVGALLAMVHNAIVEDDFDHSAYRFWSSYLDDVDFDDDDDEQHQQNQPAIANLRSQSNASAKSFKQLVKRRMSKDEANRVMPFWSFDKIAEGRDAGETYVFRQNRKAVLKDAFDRCEKVLLNKNLLKTLPKAAVHGDFNPWNLIVDQPNSTPRTSTSSDSISWGVAASATELAPKLSDLQQTKKSRVDSLTSPPPVLTAPLTVGRYKLNGIIDFGESHFTFLIFDIAIAMSSMLDVMYGRHFQHPSTPESSAISSAKSYDFSAATVQASAAQRAALEAAAAEPLEDAVGLHDAAAVAEHDPMFAEAARKVEKWFNCFIAGYETKRPLSHEERDAVVPLILGWEAMAIALSKKELAKQPENRYVQGFCNDQDWRRLSSFLKIFPGVEARNGNNNKPKSASPTTPTRSTPSVPVG